MPPHENTSSPIHPQFPAPSPDIPPLHRVTMKASSAFARMLHIEAMSGIVLLIAAAIALIWANSPWAASYFATWHAPLALTLGPWTWSTDLHFFVNDVLMTIFFLVVGMEIRREMYNGALADVRQALLPIIAALVGLVLVLLFNRMGVAAAWAYVVPGAILWLGLLHTGAHPTLAGVVLGLMTPVTMRPAQRHHLDVAEQALTRIRSHAQRGQFEVDVLHHELRIATTAQRDLLPPVFRLPAMLHPWVAFGVMPIFALANAGVQFGGMDLAATGPHTVFWGVLLALVLGKPLGVFLATFLAVKSGVSPLPEGINWRGVLLVGVLAGIGFTMAIFVGGLAFSDAALLSAAKLGILAASATAAIVGLVYGFIVRHKLND